MKIELSSGLSFDFTNMFGEQRLSENDLTALIKERGDEVEEAVRIIREQGISSGHLSKDGEPEHVYFTRMPYLAPGNPNTEESISKIEAFSASFKEMDAVVFLGIGGSYLGNKVLFDTLAGENWNEMATVRQGRPQIYFCGNNVDGDHATAVINSLKHNAQLAGGRQFKVMLVPISKSGTTMETMVGLIYFYEALKEAANIEVNGAVVTDLEAEYDKAPLLQIAGQLGWEKFAIKEGIGGRFSVMTDLGLLVLSAIGGNIREFLRGARTVDEYCQQAELAQNPSFVNAALKFMAYERNVDTEVFMPYGASLKSLSEWYIQLLAESLGKRLNRAGEEVNYGRTPLVAVGTTDMHAQTQQHQDGKRNKVVQFVEIAKAKTEVKLSNPFVGVAALDKYEGLAMHDLLKVALDANEAALSSDNRYNARFVLPELNEFYLGQLMYFLMLSIAYEGELADVDAYDQPGVETYKKFMKKSIG